MGKQITFFPSVFLIALNAQIRVADRPMTKQGLTGMKTAAGRGKSINLYRASDISRGRGPAKFRYFREIPRNSQKNAKYREIRQKYFQIHVGKTYLINTYLGY